VPRILCTNRRVTFISSVALMASFSWVQVGQAQIKKLNVLVIFGDDVGDTDISAHSMGVMGFTTPNIDRIAREGMIFTDHYAENSCTAGRSTFITGQIAWRTGLSKVGVPGGPASLQPRDITIAQAIKPLGYATGQFGKNHLGDRNEFLPTNHGFDEFFGSLYHLNAGEEPKPNAAILLQDDHQVTFRWRDSAHKNEQRRMTLSLDEFLRRFLLHLLPDGFVRIGNFGFLANRRRATFLPLCFQLLDWTKHADQDTSGAQDSRELWLCPKCAAPMRVVERLTAAEIQLRSPPEVTAAA
jgi:hypothetical protein